MWINFIQIEFVLKDLAFDRFFSFFINRSQKNSFISITKLIKIDKKKLIMKI